MTAPFVTEDQSPQLALLADPATHGLPAGTPIERIDTHASAVFIGPAHVLKLKRAVRFDFMDFSTVEKRRLAAIQEVRLNRRTAPSLYLGLRPILRADDGELTLGDLLRAPERAETAAPKAVDWVVAMNRFEPETLFDRQAVAGRLTCPKLARLARTVAAFHARASAPAGLDWSAVVGRIARDTLRAIAAEDSFERDAVAALSRATDARCAADAPRLAARAPAVRRCHGDLHLRNICEIDGQPTLFDCIEFNPDFAAIDPLYDLAFLVMDLAHRGLDSEAALVRDRYIEATGAVAGHGLMPLYLSMRAAVRAKVDAAGARTQAAPDAAEAMRAGARRYLAAARRYLRPAAPALIALGGYSGTGKSTLARALAPFTGAAPGAVVLRTDALRKARYGVAETERLPPDAYAPAVSQAVYATLEAQAAALLADGVTVIADATFTHAGSRARMEDLAGQAGVPFAGLWLEAPAHVLEARVAGRTGDASDADLAVLRRQLAAGAGRMRWTRFNVEASSADLLTGLVRTVEGKLGRATMAGRDDDAPAAPKKDDEA